jgi:hypothetical protein
MRTLRALASSLALALAGPALAALVVPVSVEELTRRSDTVVRGRIERVRARWSADGKRIFTHAEVAPSSVWRGSAPARLTVVSPGGVVGDIGQSVGGAPAFSEGEEVVLFLGKAGGSFRVRGMGQGKFKVSDGQARPQLEGLAFARGAALRGGERRVEPMGIDELERRVRAAR